MNRATSNVEKMRSGTPLTDDDRWPWFERLAAEIDRRRRAGEQVVIACSALKRAYREALVGGHRDVCLVYLQGSRELLLARMAARRGHYMPASLLDSQLATLQPPGDDESPLTFDVALSPDAVVAAIVAKELHA